ncbi:MAG TPA: hypothetical protein VGR26_07545, partial [Acidimicrobiales bacterium]|nr:hypothetical protein [Acidimicrobiales bacterium]
MGVTQVASPERGLLWPVVGAAVLVLAPALVLAPTITLAVAAAGLLAAAVVVRPQIAAYLLLATTPLIVGMDRGSVLPVLRPSEALGLLLGAALLCRGLVRLGSGERLRARCTKLDGSIVLLAVTSSVVPLLWMMVRRRPITTDDLLYALTLWKFFGIYLIVKASVRTEAQVRRCLWLSMGAAGIVAVIAILQALQLFNVPGLLSTYYAPFGEEGALGINRGTSTLASSIATGDLMAFNLGVAMAWLFRGGGRRSVLLGAVALFVVGGLASGQFSGVIAVIVVVASVGLLTGRLSRTALATLPVALVGGVLLQPVIERRLRGFQSGRGLPPSWLGRLENLRTYFWPELFSNGNFLLGVRPAARVPAPELWRQYVWIESGHTWLLWNGGVPLLVAFFVFLWTSLRTAAHVARTRDDAVGVAATAGFSALVAVAVLM